MLRSPSPSPQSPIISTRPFYTHQTHLRILLPIGVAVGTIFFNMSLGFLILFFLFFALTRQGKQMQTSALVTAATEPLAWESEPRQTPPTHSPSGVHRVDYFGPTQLGIQMHNHHLAAPREDVRQKKANQPETETEAPFTCKPGGDWSWGSALCGVEQAHDRQSVRDLPR